MERELHSIITNSLNAGLLQEELLAAAPVPSNINIKLKKAPFNFRKFFLYTAIITILYSIKNPSTYLRPLQHLSELKDDFFIGSKDACLMHVSHTTLELVRPLSKCSICESIDEVPVLHNISKEYFLEKHAYTGVPVLIKNYAKNWSALNIFSYRYFRILYNKLDVYDEVEDCQFFPYKTNFLTLEQFFKMSKKRADLKKDQWYVGWSNCIPRLMKIFRKHYQRPSFLPSDSESSQIDWIFMGGSGYGASIHIDSVNRPSWQAMIKGKKTWYLEAPPECEHVCKRHLNVTMEPGDILVVDTNRWYHGTYIHPGNMSITIGSEYD